MPDEKYIKVEIENQTTVMFTHPKLRFNHWATRFLNGQFSLDTYTGYIKVLLLSRCPLFKAAVFEIVTNSFCLLSGRIVPERELVLTASLHANALNDRLF